MAKPIVYGPGFSTYTRSVLIALQEKGVDYELVEINFLDGGMPAEQVARHPFSKVPAFEHDGFGLYEAAAIMRYVDEAFAGPPLQPSGAQERATMTQAICIVDSYAYPATISQLFIQRAVVPMLGGESDEAIIEASLPEVDKSMGALERLLGAKPYLAGDEPTLADFHLVPVFGYFTATPESEALLTDRTNLNAWWARMSKRASVKATEPQLG